MDLIIEYLFGYLGAFVLKQTKYKDKELLEIVQDHDGESNLIGFILLVIIGLAIFFILSKLNIL